MEAKEYLAEVVVLSRKLSQSNREKKREKEIESPLSSPKVSLSLLFHWKPNPWETRPTWIIKFSLWFRVQCFVSSIFALSRTWSPHVYLGFKLLTSLLDDCWPLWSSLFKIKSFRGLNSDHSCSPFPPYFFFFLFLLVCFSGPLSFSPLHSFKI